MKRLLSLVAALGTTAGVATAEEATPLGTAVLQDRYGAEIGEATLFNTPSGLLQVVVQASDVPAGVHGVHVHETGDCSAEDFTSAGGHLAADAQHGILVEGGPHPGDLPNVHVQDDGVLAMEAFKANLSADQIFDSDGSAIVVHADPDDYQSQPAGNAGDRIACGVIEQG